LDQLQHLVDVPRKVNQTTALFE